MRVLIIDQCSGTKTYDNDTPELTAKQIDDEPDREKLVESSTFSDVARKLYTGRQQNGIDEAVDGLRASSHEVDRFFVSAGFGLVSENDELPAYNVAFETETEARERGNKLQIPSSVKQALQAREYDVVFFALGAKYYTAIDLEQSLSEVSEDAVAVVFNNESLAESKENVLSLVANTSTGRKDRVGGGAIGVKAEYLKNFATHASDGTEITTIEDVRRMCLPDSQQVSFDSISGEQS